MAEKKAGARVASKAVLLAASKAGKMVGHWAASSAAWLEPYSAASSAALWGLRSVAQLAA